ncbi:MAG: FAD:protein FMN transferase [Clostridiales bacterium]|nr:FAD:protein FMN transferase [Clostridiales bacterium]
MKKNIFKTCAGILVFVVSSLCLCACVPSEQKYRAEFYGLFDTEAVLTGYAESEAAFARRAENVRARLEELHRLFDIYHSYENVNNLYTVNESAGKSPVKVDGEIIGLLKRAREGYELTGGKVNAAMGAVLSLWHDYRSAGISDPENAALPPADALAAASRLTDMNDLMIDEAEGTVFLREPGMSLDVGAIAKAYAADVALSEARGAGFVSALLNIGGNVTAVVPPEGGRASWNVGVQDPALTVTGGRNFLDILSVSENITVSGSGAYERFYTVNGQNYGHIIDPETLSPARLHRQVTVLHKDAWLADTLSTALFLLPYDEGLKLAEENNAQALWITLDGEWLYTEGYARVSKEAGKP